MNKPIGEIQKNEVEKIVARVYDYKGKERVDIRTYFNPDTLDPKKWIPTKKGISIDARSWKAFKKLIGEIDKTMTKGEKSVQTS